MLRVNDFGNRNHHGYKFNGASGFSEKNFTIIAYLVKPKNIFFLYINGKQSHFLIEMLLYLMNQKKIQQHYRIQYTEAKK